MESNIRDDDSSYMALLEIAKIQLHASSPLLQGIAAHRERFSH